MKVYKGKIKKKITIKLIGDAEKAFQELNKIVGEQRNSGITSSKDITLLNAIDSFKRRCIRHVLTIKIPMDPIGHDFTHPLA